MSAKGLQHEVALGAEAQHPEKEKRIAIPREEKEPEWIVWKVVQDRQWRQGV
jgi:hypothetical protein